MPLTAAAVEDLAFLRLLVMGAAKAGKSCSVISTAPSPVYVINSDDDSSLRPVTRRTQAFEWGRARTIEQMEVCLKEAREGVKNGKYKTIVWDTMSNFGLRLEEWCLAATNNGNGPDGRRAYPEMEKRLRNIVERLFNLPAHVIAISHFLEVGGETTEGQMAKSGVGIVPLLPGKSRGTIPALFQDVCFFECRTSAKSPEGERVFVTSAAGVWGPGCRSLEGHQAIPADVQLLMGAFGMKGGKKWAPPPKKEVTTAKAAATTEPAANGAK